MEDDRKTTYKDYYKVLEVEYDASDETIRLNYRKLALEYLSRFKGMILTSNGLGMSSVWSEQLTEFNKLMDK